MQCICERCLLNRRDACICESSIIHSCQCDPDAAAPGLVGVGRCSLACCAMAARKPRGSVARDTAGGGGSSSSGAAGVAAALEVPHTVMAQHRCSDARACYMSIAAMLTHGALLVTCCHSVMTSTCTTLPCRCAVAQQPFGRMKQISGKGLHHIQLDSVDSSTLWSTGV